jgi:DNA-binding response OmpR family regulator
MIPPRILVIDDDAIFRKLAGVAFGGIGLEVVACADGASAQAALAAGGFALLMLDLEVPGLDSFGMIAAVNASGDMPVLVCSGRTDTLSRERAMANGATAFVSKPVDWRALPARVQALVQSRG